MSDALPPTRSHIEFQKTLTLGNLVTLGGMILSVGSIYGIQSMINDQVRKDVDRNFNDLNDHREQLITQREAQLILTYDVKAIKQMTTEMLEEQKAVAKELRESKTKTPN